MEDSLCVYCESNPIEINKWGLCIQCYRKLRSNGALYTIPPVPATTRRRESLIKKYGESIVDDFNGLLKSQYTLQQVGDKHGFTRERARQLFESVFGFKYTAVVNVRKHKNRRSKKQALVDKKDPRLKAGRFKDGVKKIGAESEAAVFNVCENLGYEIKPYDNNTIDLVINGYKVEIKSSHKTTFTSKGHVTPQYHFQLLPTQRIADYVVCHAVPINKFFVIPSSVISGDHFYIPEKKVMTWRNSKQVRISHWYDYEEAWHLLRPQEGDVVFSKAASQ